MQIVAASKLRFMTHLFVSKSRLVEMCFLLSDACQVTHSGKLWHALDLIGEKL